ncbi:hypothetical protein GOP47_0020134 [Adiantum capillus-veneris]|uniref:Small multi-drug export protein n=1 Tax=Adiantum capillus-veneris TaxID=13818 RepID=A0A9D4Z8D5_ADICA|nr:hypothetical protein GOP47_0020134 [Adiantum capillus-veneris]
MAMAWAAQRAFIATLSAASSDGASQLGLRKPCHSLFRQAHSRTCLSSFSPLQVVYAHSGESLRPKITADSSRLVDFPLSNSESSNPTLHKLPLARIVVFRLTVVVLLSGLLFCGCAQASEAIKASSLGLKVASFLRQTGWPDEAIVFLMATLPVLELRGAIPVGYWMQMDPLKLSLLSVLGNMVMVPILILYLEKTAKFLSNKNSTAKKMVDAFFESTRKKAAPVEEFEWLGLMLFVAVPFPGTGAWTGAMVASVLGMPFWKAMSANFCGVVMAGLLVNLLVNLGLNYAIMVGAGLFLISTFMWSFLRVLGRSKQ